ncbi:unnamed protein product [Closterium sp. Yama58-4]|nr:unnamed protein product [Closterium sp. Yama58-4]
MDPSFIRPMPVLHATMAHMLSLLHVPFPPPPSAAKGGAEEGEMEGEGVGEEGGGAGGPGAEGGPGMRVLLLHSFLWDRMRAVRADLRMQHLFGREAINMHEQMVRFHIVAMHELCEYPKGEGFSDGFDAHLNIEQMNKACVDLFHMYHDRRADLSHAQARASEGEGGEEGEVAELEACLANEGELRGYYLLLKIDRHPGFNVEPAEFARELSLLPHIVRSSPEVVFARSVARACRTHNFVAFFRLARQATYLQACLMHAHFSKMRSRALAAVYSSIAKGQQLPALTLAHWLGMEQEPEKLRALVEHHGLALHPSDAPDATFPDTAFPASVLLAGCCLVKGAPLLQAGTPLPPSSSALVRSKQSQFIDDVIAEVSSGAGGGGGGEEKGGEQVERQQWAEEQRRRQQAWLQQQQQQQQQQQKMLMEQRQREEQMKAMEEKQRALEREMERERERVRELERRAAIQAQVKRQEEKRRAREREEMRVREEEKRREREAEAAERERREKEREEQVRQERRRKEMEMRERILKERARVEREKREAEQREKERQESITREKERKERERRQWEEEERQRRVREEQEREEQERERAALEEAGRKARGVWLRRVVRRWRQNAAQQGQLRRLRQLAVSDWQLEGSIASQPTVVASKQAPHKRLRGAATWGPRPPALGKASAADRGGTTADSRLALAAPSAGGPRFLHPSAPWGRTGFAAPTAFAAPSVFAALSPLDVARLVGGRLAGRQVPSSSAGPLLSARRVVSWKLLVCWPERESQDTPSPLHDATHWLCSTLSAPSHALNALQHQTAPPSTPRGSSASQPSDPSLLACYVAPMPHRTAAGEAAPELPGGSSGADSGETTRARGQGSASDWLFWLVVRRVSAQVQSGDGGRFMEGAQAMVCVVDGNSNAEPQVQHIRQAVASLPTSLAPIPLLLLVLPPHPPPPSATASTPASPAAAAAAAAAASMCLSTGPCAPVPVPSSFASLTLSQVQHPSTRPPGPQSAPPPSQPSSSPAPRLSALRILPLGRTTPPQPDDVAPPDWPAKIALASGLRWLADSSPLPPQLAPLPLRDLVLRHLSPRVTRLLAVDPSLVRPQECITEFNASLDSAANDIATAVAVSPLGSGTPLPELPALLQLMGGRGVERQRQHTGESRGSEMGENRSKADSAVSEAAGRLEASLLSASLPPSDWNSPSRTSHLTTALSSLRLPHFPALHLSSSHQPSLTSPSSSPSPTLSLPPHLSSLAPQLHSQLAPLSTALHSFLRLLQGDQTPPVLLAQQVQQLLAEGCGVVWRSGGDQGQRGEKRGEQGDVGSARSAGRLCVVPVWPRILLPVFMRRLDALFSDPPLTAFVLATSAPPAARAAAPPPLASSMQSTGVVAAALAAEVRMEVGASAVESGGVGLGSMLPVSAVMRQEGLVGTGMVRELIRTSGSAWVGGAAATSATSDGLTDDEAEGEGGNEVASTLELPPLLAAPSAPSAVATQAVAAASWPNTLEPYQSHPHSRAWHAITVPIPGLPTSLNLLRSSPPSFAAAAAFAPRTSLLTSRPTPSPSPSPPPPLLQLPHPSAHTGPINQPLPHSHLLPASHHVPVSPSRTNHKLPAPILPVSSHSHSHHSLARHPPLPLYKPGSGSVYKPVPQHEWVRGLQVKRKARGSAWGDGYGGGGRVGCGSGGGGREGDERGEGEERGGVERKEIERGWVEREGKEKAEHWFGPGGRRQQLRLAESDGLVANEMLPRGIVRAADVIAASGVGGGGDEADGLLRAGAHERRVREMVDQLMKRRQSPMPPSPLLVSPAMVAPPIVASRLVAPPLHSSRLPCFRRAYPPLVAPPVPLSRASTLPSSLLSPPLVAPPPSPRRASPLPSSRLPPPLVAPPPSPRRASPSPLRGSHHNAFPHRASPPLPFPAPSHPIRQFNSTPFPPVTCMLVHRLYVSIRHVSSLSASVETAHDKDAMRQWSRRQHREGRTVALVPTMGYLHDGHLSLVRLAASLADVVAVSIYVNPSQFAPHEDLLSYPRDLPRDLALLKFAPHEDLLSYPRDLPRDLALLKVRPRCLLPLTYFHSPHFHPPHFLKVCCSSSRLHAHPLNALQAPCSSPQCPPGSMLIPSMPSRLHAHPLNALQAPCSSPQCPPGSMLIPSMPSRLHAHPLNPSLLNDVAGAAVVGPTGLYLRPLYAPPDHRHAVAQPPAAAAPAPGSAESAATAAAAAAGHETWVTVERLQRPLCGGGRPVFFRGVATVVLKLLHIVEPDVAVFGKKDYQQWRLIQRMKDYQLWRLIQHMVSVKVIQKVAAVLPWRGNAGGEAELLHIVDPDAVVRDLDMAVQVVGAPLLREADGLAMSSRNVRLSPEHRLQALSISRALLAAKAALEAAHSGTGESERGEGRAQAAEASAVVERVRQTVEGAGGRVEYVQVGRDGDEAAWDGDEAAWDGDEAAWDGDEAAWDGDEAAWDGDEAARDGDEAAWDGDEAAWDGDEAARDGDGAVFFFFW